METALSWIGAIGGALGGIGAVIALVYAHRAQGDSQAAGDLAKRSEELAVEANLLSTESNGIAVDARKLAEEANTISLRSEARETEVYDVRWEGDWIEPGKYQLVNIGQNEALAVRAEVVVHEERRTAAADRVEPGGLITLEFPGAKEEFTREINKIRRERQLSQSSPFPGLVSPTPYYHFIGEHVTSKTPLGKPLIHAEEHRLGSLGDHDRYL